jgi:hypothetical protein
MDKQAQIKKGIEVEGKEHPWASEDILHKIVLDEIRANPDAYMDGQDDDQYQGQEQPIQDDNGNEGNQPEKSANPFDNYG